MNKTMWILGILCSLLISGKIYANIKQKHTPPVPTTASAQLTPFGATSNVLADNLLDSYYLPTDDSVHEYPQHNSIRRFLEKLGGSRSFPIEQ